jgi:hypothetical protein
MATYSVATSVSTYSNTLTASTADVVTFADRAGYVTVTNTGATLMYARADGVTAVAAAEGTVPVMPGATVLLANGQAIWHQSSNVIPAGTTQYPTGGGSGASATSTTADGQPGNTQPYMSSLAGQATNPGTKVSLISTAADTYTIALAG